MCLVYSKQQHRQRNSTDGQSHCVTRASESAASDAQVHNGVCTKYAEKTITGTVVPGYYMGVTYSQTATAGESPPWPKNCSTSSTDVRCNTAYQAQGTWYALRVSTLEHYSRRALV